MLEGYSGGRLSSFTCLSGFPGTPEGPLQIQDAGLDGSLVLSGKAYLMFLKVVILFVLGFRISVTSPARNCSFKGKLSEVLAFMVLLVLIFCF